MMEISDRRLVSIRRLVPKERLREYAELWNALHAATTAHGAHAWHFVSQDYPDVFLEFLEFGSESDVRADPATHEAILALQQAFNDAFPLPRVLENWAEVRQPTETGAGDS